jgi:hypothetical protein
MRSGRSQAYDNAANARRGLKALLGSSKNTFKCVKGPVGNQKGPFKLSFFSEANGQTVAVGEGYDSDAACRRAGLAASETIRLMAAKFRADLGTAYDSCGPRQ